MQKVKYKKENCSDKNKMKPIGNLIDYKIRLHAQKSYASELMS